MLAGIDATGSDIAMVLAREGIAGAADGRCSCEGERNEGEGSENSGAIHLGALSCSLFDLGERVLSKLK